MDPELVAMKAELLKYAKIAKDNADLLEVRDAQLGGVSKALAEANATLRGLHAEAHTPGMPRRQIRKFPVQACDICLHITRSKRRAMAGMHFLLRQIVRHTCLRTSTFCCNVLARRCRQVVLAPERIGPRVHEHDTIR